LIDIFVQNDKIEVHNICHDFLFWNNEDKQIFF